MEQLKSIEDFDLLYNRICSDSSVSIPTIVIPAGTCGQASGANDLIRIAKREVLEKNLKDKIRIRITGCHGYCELEPSVLIEPNRTFYPKVGINDMVRIIDATAKNEVVADLLYLIPETGQRIEKQEDLPFYKKQKRSILAHLEQIDPIRIYNYIEIGGYMSLIKVLEKNDPGWVVNEIKSSGIRGRGGAGFPTGLKWEMLAKQPNNYGKFIVCNADEGDPGAYMDRSVLEGNPHSVIEGMIIGAFATGTTEGVIYVRAEYPLAIKHLTIAARQARDLGLLGKNILGTDFSFDIRIVKGAGAFVCGEETALIRSIEGEMGEPRQRPPYPIQKGINGRPTAINNVETWANIPLIIQIGAKEFSNLGTTNNSGTKIFSLVGKAKNTGLVEVPMGIKIKEIVFDIGGGPSGKAKVKAVQTGGPSGGCIPVEKFDLPIDYDSLAKAGSIMGSGGMIVMDENTCMVDVAKYFMNFLKDESCGKCFACRKGTQRMYEILNDISTGKGTLEQMSLLEELAEVVKDTTMCGLGQTASNPVLSTLHYYRDEYLQHITKKECTAGVCKELVGAPCQNACPLGTEAWRYVAYIAREEYEAAYRVIREANPFPSVCARVCSHPCEDRCRAGTTGGQAIAIRALKRFVTDNVDPSIYKPIRVVKTDRDLPEVAIVGAGPAGLTAAHYLSLQGYKVTVFEEAAQPGGMLLLGIPEYRMPRDILQREIDALLDENITLKCNTAMGKDFTLDSLFEKGYKAVFLAIGAHKSRLLNIAGEDAEGVYPALEFLRAFNTRGENRAKGHVGVIGGGNSAIDAARVSLRQEGVKSVTILYRRTRQEMPALEEEIEAALEEGVQLKPLLTPTRIISSNGRLEGVEFITNELGEVDASGRRRPVPVPDTEHVVPLDTLIVTIGDTPDTMSIQSGGIDIADWGTVKIDKDTLVTSKPGVFAGGDLVTGPDTVVRAIAAGKKAAIMMDRYLCEVEMIQPPVVKLPKIYIEPTEGGDEEPDHFKRVEVPTVSNKSRRESFAEVELPLAVEAAKSEARRCMRCDLEFTVTRDKTEEKHLETGKTGEKLA